MKLTDCPECQGEGMTITQVGTAAVCCINAYEHGNCCNNPVPEAVFNYEQCQRCEATGKIKDEINA